MATKHKTLTLTNKQITVWKHILQKKLGWVIESLRGTEQSDPGLWSLHIEKQFGELYFSDLETLSELFGTKNINIENNALIDGYYDSHDHNAVLYISDIPAEVINKTTTLKE